MADERQKAGRNRTLSLTETEIPVLREKLVTLEKLENGCFCDAGSYGNQSGAEQTGLSDIKKIENTIIQCDILKALEYLPDEFAELIIIDPPYNLTKKFGGTVFSAMSNDAYDAFLESWFPAVCRKLKKNGSLYICGDWKCTSSLQRAVEKELPILNRITWQREKGRGAKSNWKNGMEDIWFAVKNPDDYTFNLDSVMMKRRVIAPYKQDGKPKDWQETDDGNFRLTHPSNFWDDISVPFWSMKENTNHPTQKPEKLYAKLILASSNEGDMVFEPFSGSGTACVTAKKLGRKYCGIEINEEYCLWAEKRLADADADKAIQGYFDGVFWERNSLKEQLKGQKKRG
ncbi:MAG: site-specific DNA-methyltransferase [Treponemataceae bacterium]|nr:site-specific DNA-methyltransferase [Treponemataceae bacterium]